MRNNKNLLKAMKTDFKKSAIEREVPERLQKENIIEFLNKESAVIKKEPESNYVRSKNRIIVKRVIAVAAALAVIFGSSYYFRDTSDRTLQVSTSEFEGYNSSAPIRGVKTIDEVKQVISEISSSTDGSDSKEDSDKKNYVQEPTKAAKFSIASKNQWIQKSDVVKSDDNYLYILASGKDSKTGRNTKKIKIVDISNPSQMNVVSEIGLYDSNSAKSSTECNEIYLANNTLVVILQEYTYCLKDKTAVDSVVTKSVFYDITDRANPSVVHENTQDGAYISSLLFGNKLAIFTESEVDAEDENPIPYIIVDGIKTYLESNDIYISVNMPTSTYLIATLSDVHNYDLDVATLAILGSGRNVSCVSGTICISRQFKSLDSDSAKSEIYRLDCKNSNIVLSGSYVVDGLVYGPLSIDESGKYIRFFTDNKGEINAYILNQRMKPVCTMSDVTGGKKATDVNFVEDIGYVSTGNDVIVVDFSDSKVIKDAEEPISEKELISVFSLGKNYNVVIEQDNNDTVFVSLVKINGASPETVVSTYILKNCPISSSLLDIKSLVLSEDNTILGLPILKKNSATSNVISSYILFRLGSDGIDAIGTYNHSDNGNKSEANRGVINGDMLYTISGDKVTSFSIKDSKVLGSIDIEK